MIKTIDLTDQRFGRLVVTKLGEQKVLPSGQKMRTWVCTCDCGNTVTVYQQHLRRGDTKSCGCYRLENSTNIHTTHGETKTRLYKTWDMMRQRCFNPNDHSYRYYGAKGITICEEWNDFLAFKQWALENGYKDNLTIDRIDVYGNYEPSNCRWSDSYTQANNKTTSRYLEYNGKKQTITQWAKELNIPMETLYRRVTKLNWDIESALTKPVRKHFLKGGSINDQKTVRNVF